MTTRNRCARVALVSAALLTAAVTARAQCFERFESSGAAGDVLVLETFDDGSGAAIFAAGRFRSAGDVVADRIARFDGTTWSALGSGLAGPEPTYGAALGVFDDGSGDALYVGGEFDTAGGTSASNIARWDGTTWSALGAGLADAVLALTVFDEDGPGGNDPRLFAGGLFRGSGAVPVNHVARWNGTGWSALGGGGGGTDGPVEDMIVFDDGSGPALYVGGEFRQAGSGAAPNVARWDGTSWSSVGPASAGPGGAVQALGVFGSRLYAGGEFQRLGGVAARRLASWDGSNWARVGGGVEGVDDPNVRALAVYDDGTGPGLYTGGRFLTTLDAPPGGLVLIPYGTKGTESVVGRWNGASWTKAGLQVDDVVRSFTSFDPDGLGGDPELLFAAGQFGSVGAVGASRLAALDPNMDTWLPIHSGTGTDRRVTALTFHDDTGGLDPYAGGDFRTAGDIPATHVARWDGTTWAALGTSLNGPVHALASYAGQLYAGGAFTLSGDSPVGSIARWNGTLWTSVGISQPRTLTGPVHALATFNPGGGERLYVGGSFDRAALTPASRIACWNGSSWQALGSGVGGPVFALTVFDDGGGDALYVGGDFATAGGSPAGCVARWDGTSWSSLAGGLDNVVRAMTVFDDGGGPDLYVGGDFGHAGSLRTLHVARWDGNNWSDVLGGVSAPVHALTTFDDDGAGGDLPALVAGGAFERAGGNAASHVTVFDGTTWSALGNGTDAPVLALSPPGSPELWLGGEFEVADGRAAGHVTRLTCNLP